MARPQLDIDPRKVMQLAALGAKTGEIASFFGCDPDTITGRFEAELAEGRANMKIKIRDYQMALAKKGNATMLIWLGKQYLDQTDEVVVEQKTAFTFAYDRPNKK